jgi:2,5-dioxopentanoate dehydrogenase
MLTGKNQIGTQQIANGKKTYQTIDPITNTANPQLFIEATTEEIALATSLAHHAFASFQKCSGESKAAFLNGIADELLALDQTLLDMYCLESGLPKGRAEGERGRTVGQLRSFAALLLEGNWIEATIDTALPDRLPLPRTDIRKMLHPIGPVVVFGSSNFPFAYSTAGGDTTSALAAGCPVIVKSHPMHAGTSELVASAIIRAAEKTNMPNGVFSNLNSSGIEVGQQLAKDPSIKAIGFTGSIKAGRALYDIAAARPEPIPVFAEMGSINPVILLPEILQQSNQVWAEAYAGSITLGTGQFCTKPGLLIGIAGDDLNTFAQHLSEAIEKVVQTSMLHPNIYANYNKNKTLLSEQVGVKIIAANTAKLETNFAAPTILRIDGKSFLNNPTMHQEVFGPFSILIACENIEELKSIISNLEGQLTGTIIGTVNEITHHKDIIEVLKNRVGRVVFNGVPTGVEVCPAMQHGGPYPASTDSRFSAVGIHAIKRWVRPVSFQNCPDVVLPLALQNSNPLKIMRLVNNQWTNSEI